MVLTREEIAAHIIGLPPEQQAEAASLALKLYGPAPQSDRFYPYRFNPNGYIPKFLKWTPWRGLDAEHPGQAEILDACARVMRQQWEKDLYEKGELSYEGDEAVWLDEEKKEQRAPASWKPKQVIQNWIRVESGNGIGKTKSASGILNWFLDCYSPSAIFTFAPGGDQARFAIWSEIRGDRENKGLPGRILEKEIKITSKHFAAHRTVSEAGGKGEERVKGKHEAFQLFVLDEADGISQTIFDAIESMTSGGNALVVLFANPKSRASAFHRIKTLSYVQTFRVSTLFHPNVVAGQEIISGAVKKDFVEKRLEKDCDVVAEMNEDEFTFKLPYDVTVAGIPRPAGTIFRPRPRFMTDVLGITPPNNSDRTLIPVGRFEAACAREPAGGEVTRARVGVDAARFGSDPGTIYFNWNSMIWCARELEQMEGPDYVDAIRKEALKLKEEGVTSLHIRVDAGYGSEVIGGLKRDDELVKAFPDYKVYEVHFGGATYSNDYYHLVTEMYAETAESLKGLAILDPHPTLEEDLCEREYDWRNKAGKDTKILQDKPSFRKLKKRSPDHGDGFVLAAAPDYLFSNKQVKSKPVGLKQSSRWMGRRPGMSRL